MTTVYKIVEVRKRERSLCPRPSAADRREFQAKPRLYIQPKGESVIENLTERHSRPHRYWQEQVVPDVLKQLELEPTKVCWSQRAGCSCGCSPGFILEGVVGTFDVFVNVEAQNV